MIKVENVHKSFGANKAVDNVSFEIDVGEVVGFLGPNGAGKTTTMRMITTYLSMDSGRITIAGVDAEHDPLGVRQHIGYLPESAPLYLDMQVLEYLKFVAAVRRIPRRSRRQRIREIAHSCGLENVANRKVGFLSKGYRQRVGLAQSMIHDPKILIMDEPTSGLDPNQIVEIRDLIKSIGREKTVILSTHILPEVQTTCSRVLIIDKGRIVADGDPVQLAGSLDNSGIFYKAAIRGDRAEIESALKAAPFIASFSCSGESAGAVWFDLRSKNEKEIGEEIFRLAVENGFVIREIRREVASLESVFASLTASEV